MNYDRKAVICASSEQPEPPSPLHRPYSTSPIDRLPTEILSCIFEASVVYSEESPWRLVLVNRRWKQVALGTHSLWSQILIPGSAERSVNGCRPYDIGGDIGRVWGFNNFQICAAACELDKALVRSGATLLNIKIYRSPFVVPPYEPIWLK
ncbi:hypothetical protein FRC17_000549, partial [Serendipita sp. 399]